MARMRWLVPCVALAAIARGQTAPSAIEIANLREDVRGLTQKVGDLTLRVEQLEAENSALKEGSRAGTDKRVTAAQLNDAVAALNRTLQATVAAAKEDTLRQAAELARRTNAPAEAPARGQEQGGRAAAASPGFSENFPKKGENYVVQRGDTLASISKKTGARVQDIINANKLTDPAHIRAGQSLFLPGGK